MSCDVLQSLLVKFVNKSVTGLLQKVVNIMNIVRPDIFMVMKTQVDVFWVVTSHNIVVGYQSFVGPCCLHLYSEVHGAARWT